MDSRKLTVLAALAVAVIAVALLLTRQPSAPDAPPLLYPQLEAELSSVTAVSIYKAGDVRAVELARRGDGWVVNERGGFPADGARVNRLLRTLAKAKPAEQKTSNPANYATLGVQDTSDAGATGSRLQLAGTPTPVNLIVGKSGNGMQSVYVRRAGEPASWLVNENIDAPSGVEAWLRKDVIDVAAERVQSATITVAAGKPYSVAKKSRTDTGFFIDTLPKGKELSSPAAAGSAATALSALTLEDVRDAKDFAADKPSAHATFRTFDGLVVEVDGWVKEGKHYVAVKPTYDAALAQQFPATATSASPPTPAVSTQDQVATDGARLAGWVFQVPDYKHEAIFKPLDALLKK